MELFIMASFIGTLVLLAVHLIDYAFELRSVDHRQLRAVDEALSPASAPRAQETAAHYDRAA